MFIVLTAGIVLYTFDIAGNGNTVELYENGRSEHISSFFISHLLKFNGRKNKCILVKTSEICSS